MTDSGPLLSTLAASGATIVAIVGGFLVTRYVTLDVEQQAARRRLREAEHELTAAKERLSRAQDDEFSSQTVEHLEDLDVYDMLRERHLIRAQDSSMVEEQDLGPVTLEEVRDQVGLGVGYHTERGRAVYQARLDVLAQETCAALMATQSLYPINFDADYDPPTWHDLRGRFPEHIVSSVWERVCDWRRQTIHDAQEAARVARLPPDSPLRYAVGRGPLEEGRHTFEPQQSFRPRYQQLVDESAGAVGASETQVRLAQQADSYVAKPRGLVLGLAVLAILVVTTLVVPVLYLVPAPAELDRAAATRLTAVFFGGVAALMAYMGGWAWMLVKGQRHVADAGGLTPHRRGNDSL